MKRKIDDEGVVMNIALIVLVIAIMIIGFVVIAAGGGKKGGDWDSDDTNPATKKRYLDVSATCSVETNWYGGPEGLQIDNVDAEVIKKRIDMSFMGGLWFWEDPDQSIEFILMDSTNTVIESSEQDISLQNPDDNPTKTAEMGPFSEDATGYKLEVRLYQDGNLEDSVTKEGDL